MKNFQDYNNDEVGLREYVGPITNIGIAVTVKI